MNGAENTGSPRRRSRARTETRATCRGPAVRACSRVPLPPSAVGMRYDTSSCPPVFSHSSSPSRSPLWGPALGPLPCARRRRRARASRSRFRRRRAPSRSPAWSTSRSAATTAARRSSRRRRPASRCSRSSSRGWRRDAPVAITARRPRPSDREPARPPGRRLLDAAVRQRLHAVPARRRQDRVAAQDQWEGQNWKRSPGNLFGDPVKVTFDPQSTTPIRLVADKVDPADSAAGRHRHGEAHQDSERDPDEVVGPADLSRRHRAAAEGLRQASRRPLSGQLHAGSLLARARPADSDAAASSIELWLADDTPRFIYVTLQHPSPYYDDSYGVNSENNGPYGDAIMQGADPRGRRAVPRDQRAVGAHAVRRIDRRLDRRRPPGVLSRTSTAARSRAAPIRWTSAITRSSTSTRTPTPTSSTRAG